MTPCLHVLGPHLRRALPSVSLRPARPLKTSPSSTPLTSCRSHFWDCVSTRLLFKVGTPPPGRGVPHPRPLWVLFGFLFQVKFGLEPFFWVSRDPPPRGWIPPNLPGWIGPGRTPPGLQKKPGLHPLCSSSPPNDWRPLCPGREGPLPLLPRSPTFRPAQRMPTVSCVVASQSNGAPSIITPLRG